MKLNIGSGSVEIPGYTNIDRRLGTEAYPLPQFSDNSVDEIRASHILEHFSFREVPKVLKEWLRVLKPGGKLQLAVPDLDKAVSGPDRLKRLYHIMGGQTDENDFHRSAFDCEVLKATLCNVGFVDVVPWSGDEADTSSDPVSLNVECRKPMEQTEEEIKIKAIMSIPRVGWNDNWGSILEALMPFGIPVERFNGVFWGQCMQRALNKAIADGVDWILTIDYDSVFTSEDLDKLIGQFGENPNIDALAALQVKRGCEFPLFTIKGQTQAEISGGPIQVNTAHFGLTLIRMDAVKKLAKPFFISVPDKDGDWGDERLDDDIYFWQKWAEAGNTVYVSPEASIGHLEVMVTQYNKNGEVEHIHVPKWRESKVSA